MTSCWSQYKNETQIIMSISRRQSPSVTPSISSAFINIEYGLKDVLHNATIIKSYEFRKKLYFSISLNKYGTLMSVNIIMPVILFDENVRTRKSGKTACKHTSNQHENTHCTCIHV